MTSSLFLGGCHSCSRSNPAFFVFGKVQGVAHSLSQTWTNFPVKHVATMWLFLTYFDLLQCLIWSGNRVLCHTVQTWVGPNQILSRKANMAACITVFTTLWGCASDCGVCWHCVVSRLYFIFILSASLFSVHSATFYVWRIIQLLSVKQCFDLFYYFLLIFGFTLVGYQCFWFLFLYFELHLLL